MFKKLKSLFSTDKSKIASEYQISDKEKATARGEPYIKVVEVKLDSDNPGSGYFELDWNEMFVAKLVRAGYVGNSQEEIVDQWFTELCRNISAQEM